MNKYDKILDEYREADVAIDTIAPVSKKNGYLSLVDNTLYYFAGGHRYKLVATLDDGITTIYRLLLENGSFALLENGNGMALEG